MKFIAEILITLIVIAAALGGVYYYVTEVLEVEVEDQA